MVPTLRQLEALVLVYRLESLTKAAAELRVTQSAMSLYAHGEALRQRQHAVRHQIRFLAPDRLDNGGLPKATILALSQGPKHDHV